MASPWLRFDAVFFDCDSTLTRVEGVDELARLKGQAGAVEPLTRAAMEGAADLESVYARRLELLQPTRGDLRAIARLYQAAAVPDARAAVAALRALDIQVFVISGGLAAAVTSFAGWLGVDRRNVCAVDLAFDQLAGRWWETWRYRHAANEDERFMALPPNPLALSRGKAEMVARAAAGRAWRTLLVGDGASDFAARAAVDLFVGYGGVVARPLVAAQAEIYIACESLAPVVALAAGPRAGPRLAGGPHAAVYARGLQLIAENRVQFKDAQRRAAFLDAAHTAGAGPAGAAPLD
jgi:phosphoserine phosphatase